MKIINPAIAEPVSLELARKQCRVDAEGSPPTHVDDDLIKLYLSAAREWCEAYLGMIVAPTTAQISIDAFPAGTIALETGPVLSVVAVLYRDADGAEQTFDDTAYELDTSEQVPAVRLLPDKTWPTTDGSADNVRVQFSVGYSPVGDSPQTAPLPGGIRTAILLITAHLYRQRENTVEKNLAEIPLGAKFFLNPIKLRRGFA